MKKHLVCAITLAAVMATSPGFAADLSPAYKAPIAAPAPAPMWSGFYVGANVGYGWGNADNSWNFFAQNAITLSLSCAGPGGGTNAFCASGSDSNSVNGVLGGVQAGYNYQMGGFVLGIETDIQGSGQSGDQTFTTGFSTGTVNPLGTLSATYTQELRWLGTTRGRIGITADRWLVYATGGAAYGEVSNNGTATATGIGAGCTAGVCPLATWSGSATRVGWTAGVGIEGALGNNWSVKAEYLHVDLGTTTTSFATLAGGFGNTSGAGATIGAAAGTGSISSKFTDDIVRVGANYRLGGP